MKLCAVDRVGRGRGRSLRGSGRRRFFGRQIVGDAVRAKCDEQSRREQRNDSGVNLLHNNELRAIANPHFSFGNLFHYGSGYSAVRFGRSHRQSPLRTKPAQ